MSEKIKDTLSMYSKTVLLVDDVPLFTAMASAFFRREQVNVLTARSAAEAVQAVRNRQPDIVFMDLYMPGGDGDEACRQIKSDLRLKSTPVIIITSSDTPQDITRCQQAGCDGYLKKPLTREQYLETCRKFIRLPGWSGKRTSVDLPASFGATPDRPLPGRVTDLSIGGVFIEAATLLEPDAPIHLEFHLGPELAPIQCAGRVARVSTRAGRDGNAAGMGVEFAEIKKLDLLTIQGWLAKQT
jgi:CheY-like chemotaxis protein